MQISLTQSLEVGVAVAGAFVQLTIAWFIVRNKLRSEFPIFLAYNCFLALASGVAIVPFLSWGTAYFYLFWFVTAVTMILEFCVLHEVLVHVLKPYTALIDLGKTLFVWAAVFLLLAGVLTALATTGPCTNKVVAAMNLLGRSMRLMQCGLLLLFFSFEKRLGLSWRSRGMSIALGLGVYAASDLSISYLTEHFPVWNGKLDIVGNVIYLAASLLWAMCFARPEPTRKNVLNSPSKLIFQRWNEALASYGYGETASTSTVESFLPGIEKTVDRVMARKAVS